MALNYNKKGSVNYTIVGTPTIVNGIASEFSDSDYLNIADTPFSNSNIVEMRIKFTPTEFVTGYVLGVRINNQYQGIYLAAFNNTLRYGMIMWTGGVGIPQVQVGQAYAISTLNVPYYLHFYFNPTTLEYKLGLSTDGRNPTYGLSGTATGVPAINQLQFGVNLGYSNYYFRGSVDLNETYIKVNGQPWFGVCPVEVKHINYGTSVGYTKEGSPTINNGVASAFSDNDYLKLSSSFSEQGDIDIVVKLTTNNDLTASQYPLSWEARPIGSLRNNGLYIVSGGKYGCLLKDIEDNSYQSTAPTAYALSANTTYYLRLLFTAADKSLKMGASTDGVNYTYGINRTLSANLCPMNTNNIRIGRSIPNNFSFLGSVDLNETYIKVNNNIWFFRPVTNYLVKDGKLVFADSDVYINDNGTKTYASANIAPVPSGFTYGTTTTTDVGLVNMVTQAFTAVPGATWGKD